MLLNTVYCLKMSIVCLLIVLYKQQPHVSKPSVPVRAGLQVEQWWSLSARTSLMVCRLCLGACWCGVRLVWVCVCNFTVNISVTKFIINLTTVLAVVALEWIILCFIWTVCFLTVNHSSCNPGSDSSKTHSRGGRSHTVLQIQTVLQRSSRKIHLHRYVERHTLVFFYTFYISNLPYLF